MIWRMGLGLLVVVLIGVGWRGLGGDQRDLVARQNQPLSARHLLAGTDATGYARAVSPRPFTFPQDHAAHPDYRHEWWYLTGNLQDAQGRRYGYQFTLFRYALQPAETGGESAWRTRQIYMGHLAVTDVASGRFHSFQRFARGALGLAGTGIDPLRIWLEDWELGAENEASPWRVRAAEGEFAINLALTPTKPIVLQGESGLSRKGSEPGNASYYYSLPRLATRGRITLGGEPLAVAGLSWLDREWGTSVLGSKVAGWDWFALQLDDGRDLMLYHLRRTDGTLDAHSAGVLVDAGGNAVALALRPESLAVTRTWVSPRTGIEYPAGWRLHLPEHGLDLIVQPLVAAQEWNQAVRYWEGAVAVRGGSGTGGMTGSGYAELTGYAKND